MQTWRKSWEQLKEKGKYPKLIMRKNEGQHLRKKMRL